MARQELKKPSSLLWDEHRRLEKDLIPISDKEISLANDIAALRRDEFANKEALDTLPRGAEHNAARSVIKKSIDGIRIAIAEKSSELEVALKQKSLITQKIKNIKSSIKNLNEA